MMSEHIHRHLDGDTPRSAVPLPEQGALQETDAAISAARAWVRGHEVPDLTSRVMAALAEEAAGASVEVFGTRTVVDAEPNLVDEGKAGVGTAPSAPTRRRPVMSSVLEGLSWIWAPRPIVIRPAMAGAFGALLLVVAAWPDEASVAPPLSPPSASAAAVTAPVYIQFRLDTPDASNVSLAGTFTEWQPAYSLYESAPGVWTVTVPLAPGVHDYLFIVDGERWVPDPAAPPVDDGFGGTNSRLLLTAPQSEA